MPTPVAAAPFDFSLDLPHAALVIIDMQRDFVEPGGFGASLGNDVTRLQAIVPTCQAVLAAWRAAGALVVHTREGHVPDLSDCPPAKRLRGSPTLRIGDAGPMGRILVIGEPGHQIVPELAPQPGEIVIDKPGKGAFHATPLLGRLQEHGITQLVFMGVTTEVCVQTTMREANDRGFDCLLVEDGTESYFPEFKAATLAMIRAQGAIVGWTAPAAALLAALPAAPASPALDLPDVRAEVAACFHAYETALMTNDVPALLGFFWADDRLTRYGIADRQLGWAEQVAYRQATPAPGFTRQLENLRITTLGRDMAVALVEFVRSDTPLRGFQSQTWARLPEGWRIVSAHVSMIPWPTA